MNKKILEVLHDEFLDFCSPIIITNIPSVTDGLLVSQRQAIWGMYKAGYKSSGDFYKMLKATGKIFDYYVCGDASLCEVMKGMANNSIMNFYLQPKGSFGNKNSRDGVGASPRYIECKLAEYAEDMLLGIKDNAITLKWNYDATEKEPICLPSIMPNILLNPRTSIAVSEANNMPSFNLIDVCNAIKVYMDTKDMKKVYKEIKVPDLPTGGSIVYNENTFNKIYDTGKGSFIMNGKWKFDEETRTLTIYEIPYTTYIETIYDDIEEHIDVFERYLEDYENGSDKNGVSLELYLKKNIKPEDVVLLLRKYTHYEDSFSCNFTILDLDGKTPRLMSLKDIISKWVKHRFNCIVRENQFILDNYKKKHHVMSGLSIIADDIDKVVKIIRSSKKKKEAQDKLINEYKLSNEQAEYISNIQLINLTQDYISNRLNDIKELQKEIDNIESFLDEDSNIYNRIKEQLDYVSKKYGQPRKTEILTNVIDVNTISNKAESYNCRVLLTKKFIKKYSRLSDNHKLSDGDKILCDIQTNNVDNLYLFSNKGNRFMIKCSDLKPLKPSDFGENVKSLLPKLEKGEEIIYLTTLNEKGSMIFLFENGNMARVNAESYISNVKSMKAYNTDSKLVYISYIEEDVDIFMVTEEGKCLIANTTAISIKGSKTTKGNSFMNVGDSKLEFAEIVKEDSVISYKGKDISMEAIATTGKGDKETRTNYVYFSGKARNKGNLINIK